MKFNNLLFIVNVLVTLSFVANNIIIINAVPLITRDASNTTDATDGKWEFIGK
jgi:hypothetical protein